MKAAECASTGSEQLAVDQEQAGAKSIDPAMRGRGGQDDAAGVGDVVVDGSEGSRY